MRRLRRRPLAVLGLALYGAAAIALPAAHLAWHANDHRHGPDGGIIRDAGATDAAHEAFDADLAALNLSDAAHLGIAQVDCALAAYTLAACDDPAAPPHSFGDELVARLPHHHAPRPIDPSHGAGSLSHFGLAIAVAAPIVLPPPPRLLAHLPLPAVDERPHSPPLVVSRARGPPRSPRV